MPAAVQNQDWTLEELAHAVNLQVRGNPDQCVRKIATLQSATPDSIAHYTDERYLEHLKNTSAGAVILTDANSGLFQGNCLIAQNPRLAFAEVSLRLHQRRPNKPGIHPSAVIDHQAQISSTAELAENVVVRAHSVIGDNVVIGAGTFVDENVSVGANTRIDANVSIYADSIIGRDSSVASGSVIGSRGFGYEKDHDNWVPIKHVGRAVIHDLVDIGACTTIDRGTIQNTVIEQGVKIDNNVQVAHNVNIGKHTVIAGNVGIAGSVRIGSNCILGGQVGVCDHIEIADNVIVYAGSLVTKSILQEGEYSSSFPVQDVRSWRRVLAKLRRSAAPES